MSALDTDSLVIRTSGPLVSRDRNWIVVPMVLGVAVVPMVLRAAVIPAIVGVPGIVLPAHYWSVWTRLARAEGLLW